MMEETETRPSGNALWRFLASCRDMTDRDRRNSWRATGWLFVWALGFLGVTWGLRYEIVPEGIPAYLAVAFVMVLGIVAVLAYVRFIREADELHRKIQLEALALGFGGGFLATFGFGLVEEAGFPAFDTGDLFLVMAVSYVVGLVLGARRYA